MNVNHVLSMHAQAIYKYIYAQSSRWCNNLSFQDIKYTMAAEADKQIAITFIVSYRTICEQLAWLELVRLL